MREQETHGQVESATPGRMRIRVDPTRRVLMPQIKAQLATMPGVSRVEARQTTGSVVVEYDQATTSHADVLEMLHTIGVSVQDRAAAEHVTEAVPKARKSKEKRGKGIPRSTDPFQEDRGMITQAGPLVVDVPRSIGYFGAVTLAVALELIPLPLGAFIAVVPFLKLLKRSGDAPRTRFVAAILEGAAIPVGGQSEDVIRVARKASESS